MTTTGGEPIEKVPAFERSEIDGIPVFSLREPLKDYTGVLLFRVGRADESLACGGVSHLVEHLALFGLGSRQDYGFNGSVGALWTAFGATGDPDQVAGFLGKVARALTQLPLARVTDEARVLRTEAMNHTSGPLEEQLWLRYGASGHGKMFFRELMLFAPEPEKVRSWAAERFTAGNSSLWFTGPPPAGLELELPSGPRIAAPGLVQVPNLVLPTWAVRRHGGISISFVVPRQDWLSVPLQIAAQRLMTRLRYERGLTYDVGLSYEPLNSQLAYAALWASSLPEHAAAVRDGVIAAIEGLAEKGATNEELDHIHSGFRRSIDSPEMIRQHLVAAAENELLGHATRQPAELLRDLEEMDGTTIGSRMAAAFESALVVFPPDCPPLLGRFHPYPSSAAVVSGRSLRTSKPAWPWSKRPRLIVGEQGVSWVHASGEVATVMFASCSAAVAIEEVIDLYGEDGFCVRIEPAFWRGGAKAAQTVLDAIPPGRVLRIAREPGTP